MQIDLILKREWFKEILSSEKVEEYRDATPGNLKKLCVLDADGNATDFKPIKRIRFFEGYTKGRREMVVECLGIEVDAYEDTGEDYFVLLLGKVLITNF